jgi:pheromone a factor receptor
MVAELLSVLVLRWFLMRRRQFTAVLASSSSGLNTNKYIRLMALSLTELAFGVPVAIYVFVANLTGQELNPYTSWEDVHHNFDTTYSITLDMISPDDARAVEFSRWVGVITAIIFFIFFGLTQEVRSRACQIKSLADLYAGTFRLR